MFDNGWKTIANPSWPEAHADMIRRQTPLQPQPVETTLNEGIKSETLGTQLLSQAFASVKANMEDWEKRKAPVRGQRAAEMSPQLLQIIDAEGISKSPVALSAGQWYIRAHSARNIERSVDTYHALRGVKVTDNPTGKGEWVKQNLVGWKFDRQDPVPSVNSHGMVEVTDPEGNKWYVSKSDAEIKSRTATVFDNPRGTGKGETADIAKWTVDDNSFVKVVRAGSEIPFVDLASGGAPRVAPNKEVRIGAHIVQPKKTLQQIFKAATTMPEISYGTGGVLLPRLQSVTIKRSSTPYDFINDPYRLTAIRKLNPDRAAGGFYIRSDRHGAAYNWIGEVNKAFGRTVITGSYRDPSSWHWNSKLPTLNNIHIAVLGDEIDRGNPGQDVSALQAMARLAKEAKSANLANKTNNEFVFIPGNHEMSYATGLHIPGVSYADANRVAQLNSVLSDNTLDGTFPAAWVAPDGRLAVHAGFSLDKFPEMRGLSNPDIAKSLNERHVKAFQSKTFTDPMYDIGSYEVGKMRDIKTAKEGGIFWNRPGVENTDAGSYPAQYYGHTPSAFGIRERLPNSIDVDSGVQWSPDYKGKVKSYVQTGLYETVQPGRMLARPNQGTTLGARIPDTPYSLKFQISDVLTPEQVAVTKGIINDALAKSPGQLEWKGATGFPNSKDFSSLVYGIHGERSLEIVIDLQNRINDALRGKSLPGIKIQPDLDLTETEWTRGVRNKYDVLLAKNLKDMSIGTAEPVKKVPAELAQRTKAAVEAEDTRLQGISRAEEEKALRVDDGLEKASDYKKPRGLKIQVHEPYPPYLRELTAKETTEYAKRIGEKEVIAPSAGREKVTEYPVTERGVARELPKETIPKEAEKYMPPERAGEGAYAGKEVPPYPPKEGEGGYPPVEKPGYPPYGETGYPPTYHPPYPPTGKEVPTKIPTTLATTNVPLVERREVVPPGTIVWARGSLYKGSGTDRVLRPQWRAIYPSMFKEARSGKIKPVMLKYPPKGAHDPDNNDPDLTLQVIEGARYEGMVPDYLKVVKGEGAIPSYIRKSGAGIIFAEDIKTAKEKSPPNSVSSPAKSPIPTVIREQGVNKTFSGSPPGEDIPAGSLIWPSEYQTAGLGKGTTQKYYYITPQMVEDPTRRGHHSPAVRWRSPRDNTGWQHRNVLRPDFRPQPNRPSYP